MNRNARWLIPAIVGVLCLSVGAGIGASLSGGTEKPAKSSSGQTAADLDQREADIKAAESANEVRSIDLDNRETALKPAEDAAKANTLEGDGVFEVGVDVKPGKWKNDDAGDGCYWSINSDPNGEDIIANSNGGGPRTIEIRKGQYLELRNDCGTWNKVG